MKSKAKYEITGTRTEWVGPYFLYRKQRFTLPPYKLLRLANVKSRNIKVLIVFLHLAHWLTHGIICLYRPLSLDIEHSDNVQKNHVPACQIPKALVYESLSPELKGWCGRQVLSVEELEGRERTCKSFSKGSLCGL